MALSSRCLHHLALAADLLFMGAGAAAAVLLLVLTLPLFSLLTVPTMLHVPLLAPLVPSLVAVPVGVLAISALRREQPWRIITVTLLQVVVGLTLAVLAGWQLTVSFSARFEADFTALMAASLFDAKWHPVFHELRCCGPSGPASFETSIPTACCVRDEATGPCSTLYSTGCVAPAADRMRAVLRTGAATHGGAAVFMCLCAFLSVVYCDSLKRTLRGRRELQVNHEDKPLRSPVANQKF